MQVTTDDLPHSLRDYFERSGVALSLAAVGHDDVPLVLVNQAFTRLTGYHQDEIVGRNCRFLQGPETSEDSKRALHDFIHDSSADAGRFPVTNYRKDRTPFRNFVFMTRLRDRGGKDRYILGSQFDMTSALRQVAVHQNDRELQRSLTDVEAIGREFGLAMIGSAQLLSDSVATMARLSLDDDGA